MSDDYLPTARWQTLKERARIVRLVRQFFDDAGYTEVQTPLLSHDTVVDAHIDPFVLNTEHGRLFLQTSPEFAMKRLLVAGADAIYQICPAFRRGEVGPWHNPEFAMLEWYRVGDTYHDQMTFTESLFRRVFEQPGTIQDKPFNRITYDAAFERAIGTGVLTKSAELLVRMAEEHDVNLPASLDHESCDELLNVLLAKLIEPTLGQDQPEFLFDYPATQSALARVRNDEPPVAERFELYFNGIELCNGYQELTDPNELAQRNAIQNGLRTANNSDPLPEDSRLLRAMQHGLPECSGVAMGLDRLIALACGGQQLNQVWQFPVSRA